MCTTWLRLFLHEPNKNCDQSLNVLCTRLPSRQWPHEKGQKDVYLVNTFKLICTLYSITVKAMATRKRTKGQTMVFTSNKRPSNTTSTYNVAELLCSGRVSSSVSTFKTIVALYVYNVIVFFYIHLFISTNMYCFW